MISCAAGVIAALASCLQLLLSSKAKIEIPVREKAQHRWAFGSVAVGGACSPCVLAGVFFRFLMLGCKRLSRLESALFLTDFRVLCFGSVNYTKC